MTKIECLTMLRITLLFRPTLVGEELYTHIGFFVQTILADRYNRRRELRVVSLESPSGAECAIKKIFHFSPFIGTYLGLKFCEH